MPLWKNDSTSLNFDRKLPFVNAVFRLIAGEYAIDDAITILEAAEAKHGVCFLYAPDSCLGGGGYLPKASGETRLIDWYPLLEDFAAFQTAYVQVDDPHIVDEAIHGHLFPFLTETSFVLQSMDFANESLAIFSSGLIVPFGFWSWSAALAEWANATQWLASPGRQIEWSYTDFYSNLGPLLHLEIYPMVDRFGRWIPGFHSSANENSPELIEHYLAWAAVVLNIVEEKTKRQMTEKLR